MCTELPPQPRPTGRPLTRRTALLASAGLAGSTVLGSTRKVRHGKLDLTYTLGEDFPAYAPGEEAIRRPGTSSTCSLSRTAE